MRGSASSGRERRTGEPALADRARAGRGTRGRAWLGLALLLGAGVAPGVKAEESKPRVWAVMIGADRYQDPAIPRGRGAAREAYRLRRWFKDVAGWENRNLLVMTDTGDERHGRVEDPVADLAPSRENLEWVFREWLRARVKPGDVVVVSYAGRTVAPPAPPGDPGREMLLPIDGQTAGPGRGGWSLADALDPLAAGGETPVVCWLDVEPLGGGEGAEEGFEPRAARLLNELARWPNVTAWIAARGGPEVPGAFTTALLEALGTADRPRNLVACLDRLNQDAALRGRGFRSVGGVSPELTLWSGKVRAGEAPAPRLLLRRGHDGPVNALAFTADGDRLITGGSDSAVKLWRFGDRALLRALHGHTVGVSAAAVSPDGRYLATGDPAGRVLLHDLVENRSIPAGPPHDRGVGVVAFLPDGVHFATLDEGGTAWLWNATDPAHGRKPLASGATALACATRPGAAGLVVVDLAAGVRCFGGDGAVLKELRLPVDAVRCAALSRDGRWLALGDDDGGLVVLDVEAGKGLPRRDLGGRIESLAFSTAGALAVGAEKAVHLLATPEKAGGAVTLAVPGRADQLAFASDGRWLAARLSDGRAALWRLDDPARPRAVPLAEDEPGRRATCLGFAPDGRALAVGDQDGGIRTWDLPDVAQRPRIPPYRGKVVGLAVSRGNRDRALDGRYLLQVERDGAARLWDLQDGRGLTTIEARDAAGEAYRWASGAILPDRAGFVLTTREGDVVRLGWTAGDRPPAILARPEAEGGGPSGWGFELVAVSPDGRKVAAGSRRGPLARVWDLETGKPLLTIRDHRDALTAVAFSADSARLLTASLDGTARVWEVAAGDGKPPAAVFEAPHDAVTAAGFLGGKTEGVVTGHRSGRIARWEAGPGGPRAAEVGSLETEVHALACAPDGSWVATAGTDRSLRHWSLSPPRRGSTRLVPLHDEQVNALIAWPDGRMFASGSDDSTVRLWAPAGPGLLGTLAAAPAAGDWVVYTEDGLFDGSAGGERQVTWLRGERVEPLEQYYESCHVFQLADRLRRGDRPRPPVVFRRPAPPPSLAIDPPAHPAVAARDAALTITLGTPDLVGLRLYQDGVPVLVEPDFEALGATRRLARVRLRPGINRFYAMAARPGQETVDGRSREVVITCGGQGTPGRLHILALGVSHYRRRALRYADRDAQRLSAFLQRYGIQGAVERGRKLTLLNEEVTKEAVEAAFDRLRAEVRGRPEDAVVVFLAGHTDVAKNRFRLLLPTFPFPDDEPALVALRGQAEGRAVGPVDEPGTFLPYATICRKLSQLNALQRLVIVDACQAEAILDDPAVRLIQRGMEDASHEARTSYILAARFGELAGEAEPLRHGLLTYALLRGMGAELDAMPALEVFRRWPTADIDRDGVVTTDELRRFAEAALPELAARFPEATLRAGPNGQPIAPRPPPAPRVRQATEAPFPLVKVANPAR